MKRKGTFKALALFTGIVMAAACFTGCSAKAPDSSASAAVSTAASADSAAPKELEPVELTWLLRIPEQPDAQLVLDKLNERLKEEINATLKIQFIDAVAYPEKTKLKVSSGEEFDIMFTSAGYGFYDYASKGAFVPLDELLAKYAPLTYAQIPEGFWDAAKVNGQIYGLPNYQIAARQSTLNIRKDMVDKYSLDTSNVKTLEDLEPIFKTLKEKEPGIPFVFSPTALDYFDTMNYLGLECIGADGTPGSIEIEGSELKVVNQFEYPAFVKMVETLKAYEQAGYLNKDLALVPDPTELTKNGEILSSGLGNYKPGIEAENLARYNYEYEFIKVTEPYVNTNSIQGTMQAISRTSKNPERAMMFLELVNTDPEIYNMIVYGLLDQHYKMAGDNTIEKIEGAGYNTNVPWMIGNTFNGYLLPGVSPEIYEQTQKLNETSKISRIMGFSFNPENVKAEISQCATINKKYLPGFQFGLYSDVAANLADFNKELKAAGMDKIIAEKQAQLDAWAAGK